MPTKIEWATESWNPVIGCSKISPGCQNCYAERLATRLRHMEKNKPGEKRHYTKVVAPGGWNGKIHLIPDRLDQPLYWKKPRRIFVCSMGDLFHEDVPNEFIDKVFDIISTETRCIGDPTAHEYLLLTKRPERMKRYIQRLVSLRGTEIFNQWWWPNLWLGVTVESDEYLWRIDELLNIPAARRFISFEPLLGRLEASKQLQTGGIHWCIAGAESGPKKRFCDNDWIWSIMRQCELTKIPLFVKQLHIDGKLSKNPAEWPKDLRVQEFPHD